MIIKAAISNIKNNKDQMWICQKINKFSIETRITIKQISWAKQPPIILQLQIIKERVAVKLAKVVVLEEVMDPFS